MLIKWVFFCHFFPEELVIIWILVMCHSLSMANVHSLFVPEFKKIPLGVWMRPGNELVKILFKLFVLLWFLSTGLLKNRRRRGAAMLEHQRNPRFSVVLPLVTSRPSWNQEISLEESSSSFWSWNSNSKRELTTKFQSPPKDVV